MKINTLAPPVSRQGTYYQLLKPNEVLTYIAIYLYHVVMKGLTSMTTVSSCIATSMLNYNIKQLG